MKLDKASKRDKKRNKRKNGMRTDGRSVFTIQNVIVNRAEEVKSEKSKKKKKSKKKDGK